MKQFLFAAAGLFAFANVNAQTTGTVKLNVNLNPIQTIVVNGIEDVDLNYTSKADYENGVSSKKDNQLTIYSTGSYEVRVTSNTATISSGTKTMDVSSIQVIPTPGTGGQADATYTPQFLSGNEQTLVKSATGGVNKRITIEYKAAGLDTYIDNYIAGQTPTTYTANLTYSIVSK
ncbi:hypothetical protein NAL32_10110 [Chryseobacterium sp. Ch-15]|uniref:DUF4402 domain-containing protein n=1 Tax=Chryseobacterium muglaense TaxID=2893752 RepID=A0A9Q3US82_9FLAO|nr:hypothetical protein [Chryseobacterium muglaense]MBD3904779.1 hypothetical protein [Chryseobacterium muglaense]MCC9033662.1 hypothetical protein [Chryseobacterium muglaense]MCM2554737.1 hypothetical protein [Chryseobacterium muglaense]